jgi:histidinol-phosphate aminotransferase
VVVLRTFSKLFGMAGMRMGYALSDPANIAAMQRYDGDALSGSLPLPSLACATASLGQTALIAQRRAFMEANLAFVTREVERRGFKVIPSRANMFMVDWNDRPARQMREAIRKQGVEIGRSWAIWPNVSRVTVSTRAEMFAFLSALDRALKA